MVISRLYGAATVLAAIVGLSACATAKDINYFEKYSTQTTKGRNIDEFIGEIKSGGARCGEKYRELTDVALGPYGVVACAGPKSSKLICPISYHLYVSFNLKTNIVTAAGTKRIENCF